MMQKKPAPPVNPDRMQKPVPGWSLTQPKGKWPWEQPPRFVNPEEAVDYVIEKLEEEATQQRFVKLMFAGISIEEITEAVARGGFMEGYYTPDVAEIIKAPVGIYLMGVAEDNDIPVNVFAKSLTEIQREREGDIDDLTLLDIMKKRNPEFANYVMGYENPEFKSAQEKKEKMSQGMLGVEMEDDDLAEEGVSEAAEEFAEDVFGGDVEEGEEE